MSKKKSRETLILTARAILARVERGEGKERTNAAQRLADFMHRHGLTDEDVRTGHLQPRLFTIPIHRQWLFANVVMSIMGPVMLLPRAKDPTQVMVRCSHADVQEISAKYDVYLRAYEYEEGLLREAFVEAQRLFPARNLRHAPPAPRHRPVEERMADMPTPPPMPGTDVDATTDGQSASETDGHTHEAERPEMGFVRAMRLNRLVDMMPKRHFHLPIGDGPELPYTIMGEE